MLNVNETAAPVANVPATETPVATAKPARKPRAAKQPKQPVAAKPVKPSKPANADKLAAVAERTKLINTHRATVARVYNGPSLAVRSTVRSAAVAAYAELLANPKHRTTLAKLSVRDESALALIVRSNAGGSFDPVALNVDRGIFSRLASVGFIARDGDGFKLSADGLAHARKAAKRAA